MKFSILIWILTAIVFCSVQSQELRGGGLVHIVYKNLSTGVIVPTEVSAVIRHINVVQGRSNFDSSAAVTQRMIEMDANPGDEKGHIIGKNIYTVA